MIRSKYDRLLQEQLELENQYRNQALVLFKKKAHLEETITQQINPALVVIQLACGRIGMGFFQYNQWLVSNAHVIKNRTEFDAGIVLRSSDLNTMPIEAIQAFHRPYDCVTSPDIVVIKTKTQHPCIPENKMSMEPTHQDSHYFYVDEQFNIHYLSQVSAPGALPAIFRCQDGSTPQPGCSGTPILSAQLTIGKISTWQFEVVGALYARCTDIIGIRYQESNQPQKLVCCVPVAQEFEQIRKILITMESAVRYQSQALCFVNLGDNLNVELAQNKSNLENQLAAANIREFEFGQNNLEINLPAGLEPLAGSGFYKLEHSHLKRLHQLSNTELKHSFLDLIDKIKQQQYIRIDVKSDEACCSNKYWRLDCKPGDKYWLLQLQDNTGKGEKVPGSNKSASSVFAEVKVIKDVTVINGQPLAEDLLASHKKVEEGVESPSILVDHKHCSKLQLYNLTEKSDANTIKSGLRLFTAVNKKNFNGFDVIRQHANDIQLVNCVDESGNTPLMLLLNDPEICEDSARILKAKLLVKLSIWNQPNNAGKTAAQILSDHPQKDELMNSLFTSATLPAE